MKYNIRALELSIFKISFQNNIVSSCVKMLSVYALGRKNWFIQDNGNLLFAYIGAATAQEALKLVGIYHHNYGKGTK
ncbi:MAG: hypothetical protein EOP56_04840 [Sphingobacteriales bacterium]|nr:MAG: hypothetical protein EOP56_04840 [Sphingobacteriales bacterium]